MMNLKKYYSFLILISFSLLNSCNDLPTELGYSLISDTVSIALITSNDTTLITGDKNFIQEARLFNAGAIYIGQSGNLKAYSFLRFSDIPDSLKNLDNIQSAQLFMFPNKYTFGDTNSNNLSFDIYEIKNSWTNLFSWDSLTTGFLDNKILGSYYTQIPIKDSITNGINLDIDKDLMLKWFKLQADTNTAKLNYGIALKPNTNSTVIRQFSTQQISDTSNKVALIKVIYKKSNNTLDSAIMRAAIEFSFTSKPEFDQKTIQIQGATGLRNKIYFDFSILPDLSAIQKSQLELTLDPTGCKSGNLPTDTTIAFDFYSSSDSLMTKPQGPFVGYLNKTTGKLICYSISSAVETWMRQNKKGFLVARFNTYDGLYKRLDKLSFYNSNDADKSKRPLLKLIYSKRARITNGK